MSSGSLIIDNADTQVHYSPGWKANGSPNEYKHTTSNTETQGASFTFNFVGTSVAVYGTLNDITFPNTTYVLDGGNPYPFFGQPAPLVQYQQIFYSSPVLPYGEHTLVGTCTDEGANVILDYLVVEMPLNSATNASSPTPTPTTAVPANPQPTSLTIAIVGGVLGGLLLLMTILALYLCWQVNGSPNEYKGTTSNTARKGESFTIKFVGTSVAVYGTVAAGTPPNSTYTLDGGDPFPFFAQRSTSIRYQQVFYSSPALPFMEHTLVGTCENEN
ncbi:hypothetical protein PLEOSDRAFT_1048347, partial [Pleurotus ostreatus PC15]